MQDEVFFPVLSTLASYCTRKRENSTRLENRLKAHLTNRPTSNKPHLNISILSESETPEGAFLPGIIALQWTPLDTNDVYDRQTVIFSIKFTKTNVLREKGDEEGEGKEGRRKILSFL